jgi:hypothetical protein
MRPALLAAAVLLAGCARTTTIGSADGGEPKTALTITGSVCASGGFVLRGLFVEPLSAARDRAGWKIDADGDGLADSAEPDPSAAAVVDVDNDGFTDFFETNRAGFDPRVRDFRGCDPGAGCTLADADGDELSHVAEAVLLTSESKLDTDADGVPDGLEVRAGLDPAVANAGDLDADGTSDVLEVQLGSDPRFSDDPLASPVRLDLSWTLTSETATERCYQLTLDNLPMRAPSGEASIFKIWLSVGPANGSHDLDVWKVACAQALLDGPRRLPDDLNLAGLDDAKFFAPPLLTDVRSARSACLVPAGWTLP